MQWQDTGLLMCVLFFVVFRSFFFEEITTRPLNDFDEARYAEVAKNVVKTGELRIPLAGGPDEPRSAIFTKTDSGAALYPYFWKPPLHTWIIASFMAVLGVNELSVRFPSLFFSLGVVLLTFFIAKKIFSNHVAPFIAVIILISMPDFSFLSSQGLAEMQLLFFSLLTAYLFAQGRNRFFLASGVAFGLAILTKSFAVFWVVPVCLIVYILSNRKWPQWKGIALFMTSGLMIALPWHIYMYQQFGWLFIDRQFITNFAGRISGAQQNIAPWYWYIKYILQFWLPWSLIVMMVPALSMTKKSQPWKLLFSLSLWIGLIIIPFSFVQSKVWWYIFPLWIPTILIIIAPLEWLPYRIGRLYGAFLILIACILFMVSCRTALVRDYGTTNVKMLASRHKNISSLAVVGRAYESVLYYFDTGNITVDWRNSKYVLTTQNQKENAEFITFVEVDKEGDLVLLGR
ncbi:glycosyltransferase family 39 protein [Candidatus Woesebacteria bacterium]|nr:glycosyltransferase family 39 protein [Candidatus Woesebacteria bacterium]